MKTPGFGQSLMRFEDQLRFRIGLTRLIDLNVKQRPVEWLWLPSQSNCKFKNSTPISQRTVKLFSFDWENSVRLREALRYSINQSINQVASFELDSFDTDRGIDSTSA